MYTLRIGLSRNIVAKHFNPITHYPIVFNCLNGNIINNGGIGYNIKDNIIKLTKRKYGGISEPKPLINEPPPDIKQWKKIRGKSDETDEDDETNKRNINEPYNDEEEYNKRRGVLKTLYEASGPVHQSEREIIENKLPPEADINPIDKTLADKVPVEDLPIEEGIRKEYIKQDNPQANINEPKAVDLPEASDTTLKLKHKEKLSKPIVEALKEQAEEQNIPKPESYTKKKKSKKTSDTIAPNIPYTSPINAEKSAYDSQIQSPAIIIEEEYEPHSEGNLGRYRIDVALTDPNKDEALVTLGLGIKLTRIKEPEKPLKAKAKEKVKAIEEKLVETVKKATETLIKPKKPQPDPNAPIKATYGGDQTIDDMDIFKKKKDYVIYADYVGIVEEPIEKRLQRVLNRIQQNKEPKSDRTDIQTKPKNESVMRMAPIDKGESSDTSSESVIPAMRYSQQDNIPKQSDAVTDNQQTTATSSSTANQQPDRSLKQEASIIGSIISDKIKEKATKIISPDASKPNTTTRAYHTINNILRFSFGVQIDPVINKDTIESTDDISQTHKTISNKNKDNPDHPNSNSNSLINEDIIDTIPIDINNIIISNPICEQTGDNMIASSNDYTNIDKDIISQSPTAFTIDKENKNSVEKEMDDSSAWKGKEEY